MKKVLLLLAGLCLSCMSLVAGAQEVLTGRLELLWGDPRQPASGDAEQFSVTLVTDDGSRLALDPAQARRAAGDLYALANRRVGVSMSGELKAGALYDVEAIVPAEASTKGAGKILGTTTWVTLMCKFADIADEQKPQSFFQSQYANTPGLLDHYWREVSYGKIDLTGSAAHGWFVLPQPRSYYVTGSGQGGANLGQLFTDCTAAADAVVNFAANGGVQGINMMFNGDLDGYAWGGGRCVTLDGVNKCWSTTWNPPWAFNNLAPLAHEMGHGYGLPHANNSDGDGDPYDNPWDVMSDAWNNATSLSGYGTLPKHINAYHRSRLGWVDAARRLNITAGGVHARVPLDRASLAGSSNPQVIVVNVPGDPATRYYTIEARRRVGNYEGNLAGDAVIIHQVDTTRGTPAWSMDAAVPPANRANNEGSMFKPGEIWTAPGNAFRVKVHAANAAGFVVSVCGRKTGKAIDACWPDPVPSGPRTRPELPDVPAGIGPHTGK
jgi:M6 family metalloprotease-like protein